MVASDLRRVTGISVNFDAKVKKTVIIFDISFKNAILSHFPTYKVGIYMFSDIFSAL